MITNILCLANMFLLLSTSLLHEVKVSESSIDPQVAIVQQQIWENLTKVPGTQQDYETTVRLRIANGNIIDADCRIQFPASSWAIASVLLKDYKEVLKKTNVRIFEVLYRLIIDPTTLAADIKINGLWRPWIGHTHPDGRGIDIGSIRASNGEGVIFDFSVSDTESNYAARIRTSLTTNFTSINQYLSPWFMCNPINTCKPNEGKTSLEIQHRNHLHVTLNP